MLVDKKMTPAPNPTRSVMPTELRTITQNSQRDDRNFRILKEYVNSLEYFVAAFDYFERLFSKKALKL